jgi:hypothetical protein
VCSSGHTEAYVNLCFTKTPRSTYELPPHRQTSARVTCVTQDTWWHCYEISVDTDAGRDDDRAAQVGTLARLHRTDTRNFFSHRRITVCWICTGSCYEMRFEVLMSVALKIYRLLGCDAVSFPTFRKTFLEDKVPLINSTQQRSLKASSR